MTAALAPFDFQGQTVRVMTDDDGQPSFVAGDVAAILNYRMASDLTRTLDAEDVGTRLMRTPSGEQVVTVLTEAGLYAAILGRQTGRIGNESTRERIGQFKRWVTHDVLPEIRKTGGYIAPQSDADRALALAHQVIALHTQVKELEPRAAVADKILDATGDYSVADAAKALTRAGLKLGERRLFTVLDHKGWISRGGDGRWRPKQYPLERQWMSLMPQSHYHPRSGELVLDAPQCRITPKGIARLLADLQPGTAVAS